MRVLILLLLLSLVNTFVLIKNLDCVIPKVLTPCEGINLFFLETAKQVASDLTKGGIPYFIKDSVNSSGVLCQEINGVHYGYMTHNMINKNITDVTISNKLFSYPNSMYNVILHEFLHTLGLNHNNGEDGLMSYSVKMVKGWFSTYIKEDFNRLWISIDDVKGILKSCYNKTIF